MLAQAPLASPRTISELPTPQLACRASLPQVLISTPEKPSSHSPLTQTPPADPDFSFSLSPPRPIRRSHGLETTARPKRRRCERLPLAKLSLELKYAGRGCSEFFRCYQEEDVVDQPTMRGKVRDSEGDDDRDSEEEMISAVQPEMTKILEQAVLDYL